MATVIQLRRDTKANWEKYNPVLAAGEIAVQTDTFQIKVGDGLTHWADLPFVSFGFLDRPYEYLNTQSITSITYDSNNMATEIDFANGAKELFTYDSNGNLTEMDVTDTDGTTVLYKETYSYDTDGRLISETRSFE